MLCSLRYKFKTTSKVYYKLPIALTFNLLFLILFNLPALGQTKVTVKTDSGSTIPDTLLFKLQKAQAAVTEVNATNKNGYDLDDIRDGMADLRNNIEPIKLDLKEPKKVIDPKTLISYKMILNDAQTKLAGWRTSLTASSNTLQRLSQEIINLSKDTLLMVSGDTTKQLYDQQLIDIRNKLQAAGKVTNENLQEVSRVLAAVSAIYLTNADLQSAIIDRLKVSGASALNKESSYLWNSPEVSKETNLTELLNSSYEGQNKILSYFINSTWDNRAMLLLVTIAFFFWVYQNSKKAAKPELKQKIGEIKFSYITALPIIPSLIILLDLTPLFEPDAPALYIEITQFALLIVLGIRFYHTLSPADFRYWVLIVILYITIIFTTAVMHDYLLIRVWLIALNLLSIFVGWQFFGKLRNLQISDRFIRPVLMIYLFLNSLAIALNVVGRVSLAKVFSITAIISLTQIIGLALFIQILTDALELQIKVSSCGGGFFSRINVTKTRVSFRKILSFVAVILWGLVFLINLGIVGGIFAMLQHLLLKPRTFGSITFNLQNVVFFSIILYISNLLQKHIGLVFGETSVNFTTNKTEQKNSKLALLRLVIIIIGLLLAFTVSGIPMDKLTVVLGALSVGIGLGMQNIVNNFVSGIILVFEKPFEIGDYVELADKKGKIQDIGIRSSKMLTQEGSEVIIPNGDLLSNRLVNWTLSNAYIKSEIVFKVNIATDLAALNKIIEEEINNSTDVVKNIPPEILVSNIGADNIELKIRAWITSIYVEPGYKNQLLRRLLDRFKEGQIKVM